MSTITVAEAFETPRYWPVEVGHIKVAGRDRLAFLQGQLSNDVSGLEPGQGIRACLLNNTGHMIADIVVYAFDGHVILETAPARVGTVIDTLDRFVIREKVLFEDVTGRWNVVTLQGGGAREAWESVVDTPLALGERYEHAPLPFTATDGSAHGEIVKRPRIGAADGYDLWLPNTIAAEIVASLPANSLDDGEAHYLRVAAGEPLWGAELSEAVIPLEAGLYDAISFSKGCYMGQEIIARIQSRGHTNRGLRRFELGAPARPGDRVIGGPGPREGEDVGWLTSTAETSDAGAIALGYVRNEYGDDGASVFVNGARATVRVS